MIQVNDMIVTMNGDTAKVLEITDTGLVIEYVSGKRKGWQDYITLLDVKR